MKPTSLAALVLIASAPVVTAGVHGNPILTISREASAALSQVSDPGITETRAIGEVIEISPETRRIVIRTDAGNKVIVALDETTEYLRVPPGERSLDKAVKIKLDEIGVGDKLYARGRVSEDRRSVPAQKLIVMLKADIQTAQERQRNAWRERGIAGIVTALDPGKKEITVQVRGREGVRLVNVAAAANAEFRRYAPGSVKFSDAAPGSFGDLKVGDQLRALGEKSADGARLKAEQVISGSFQTVTGTVTDVNAATGEIRIATLGKKTPLTIVVNRDSMVRRIPGPMATMIARMSVDSKAPTVRAGGETQQPNTGSSSGDELPKMFERLPQLPLSEIKPGEMIAVASTVGAEPSRLTAITLVAGVEAVLTAIQNLEAGGRSPSLGIGLPAGLIDAGILQP